MAISQTEVQPVEQQPRVVANGNGSQRRPLLRATSSLVQQPDTLAEAMYGYADHDGGQEVDSGPGQVGR